MSSPGSCASASSSEAALPAREQPERRRAECRSLGFADDLQRPVEGRRHDLPPERRAEHAARCADMPHRHHGVDPVEDQSHLHAGSLECRPNQMRPRVLVAQAEVGAGEIGTPQRRSLGEQVGQHHQALAPGGHRRRKLEHCRIGSATTAQVRDERPLRPAHDRAAVADRAARHPDGVRERITEQRAVIVDPGFAHRHADRAAGPEREAGDTRVDRARAEVAERAVCGAEHDGRPGSQSRPLRRLRAQRQL